MRLQQTVECFFLFFMLWREWSFITCSVLWVGVGVWVCGCSGFRWNWINNIHNENDLILYTESQSKKFVTRAPTIRDHKNPHKNNHKTDIFTICLHSWISFDCLFISRLRNGSNAGIEIVTRCTDSLFLFFPACVSECVVPHIFNTIIIPFVRNHNRPHESYQYTHTQNRFFMYESLPFIFELCWLRALVAVFNILILLPL